MFLHMPLDITVLFLKLFTFLGIRIFTFIESTKKSMEIIIEKIKIVAEVRF